MKLIKVSQLKKSENKAVIVYESVWKHTQQIAESLAEGFSDAGMDVKVYKLSDTKSSIVMREIMDAKVVCIGSGTYNNVMAPSVAAFLEHIRPCKLKKQKMDWPLPHTDGLTKSQKKSIQGCNNLELNLVTMSSINVTHQVMIN